MFDALFSRSGLSLDRLRSFLAFADAGSIAKAAPGDLNLQSQISRQIGELESFFSAELTERRGKTLDLSPAGRRLAVLIREQLQDLNDFLGEQREARKTFTLGAGASILDWMVLPVLAEIREALGGATVQLRTMRSTELVEAVKEGSLDFAVVREDALPETASRCRLEKVTFHLCVPRRLLKHGTSDLALDDPKVWQTLPFTAGTGGGQLDRALREGMQKASVEFCPVVECNSMLQVRQLVERGLCAGVLPSVGIHGLDAKDVIVRKFAPLKDYGRHLVLHYNQRQMRRRDVEVSAVQDIAAAIKDHLT